MNDTTSFPASGGAHRPQAFPDLTDDRPGAAPARRDARAAEIVRRLGGRSIVLVGIMGSGKTSVGRRLAARLGLDFVDADAAIETAARMTIAEIFKRHGEVFFRDREHHVIARLLGEGQKVLATGGGAFMREDSRACIAERGLSIWLKADLDVLMRRVRKRSNRPLLHTDDPETTMKRLIDDRYPVYALSDLTVMSSDGPHDGVVETILLALERTLPLAAPTSAVENAQTGMPMNAAESDAPQTTVPVELGSRRYDIFIGPHLIEDAGAYIARLFPGSACTIVTDRNVAERHLPALEAGLDMTGVRHTRCVVDPGEASKSFGVFAQVCDAIIEARMERRDLVVALGGGVIGDLAGFAAASVRRGMRFVQIPTTLLAQVDSSVGGKTGINSRHGKNLVGAFHQPSLVLADIGALATLPEREFRAGYAEVAKYGLIDDPAFFNWLEQNWRQVFGAGPELTRAIATSCAAKASVVIRDETEQGDRALLNLGHTFGHALEALTGFDGSRLIHGEAVAIGIACAFRFSVRLGHCPASEADRAIAHLRDVGLPTHIRQITGWTADADEMVLAMQQDKKVERGALTFILAHGIGKSFIARNVPADEARAFLVQELLA
ncbi:MAG: 3-dehydroquinate synthase [Beijerinckiaceae bacterium]|nr:3-dehydroquinate synthase [Beijerinckiaceae bacterium]